MLTQTAPDKTKLTEIPRPFAPDLGTLRNLESPGAGKFNLDFDRETVAFRREPLARTQEYSFSAHVTKEKIDPANLTLVKNSERGYLYVDEKNQRVFSVQSEKENWRGVKHITLLERVIVPKDEPFAAAAPKLPAINRVEVKIHANTVATPIADEAPPPQNYKFPVAARIAGPAKTELPRYVSKPASASRPLNPAKPLLAMHATGRFVDTARKVAAATLITAVIAASGAFQKVRSLFSGFSRQPETPLVQNNNHNKNAQPQLKDNQSAAIAAVPKMIAPTTITLPIASSSQPKPLEPLNLNLPPNAHHKIDPSDFFSWSWMTLPVIPQNITPAAKEPQIPNVTVTQSPAPAHAAAPPEATEKIQPGKVAAHEAAPARPERAKFNFDPGNLSGPASADAIAAVEKAFPNTANHSSTPSLQEATFNPLALNQPADPALVKIVAQATGGAPKEAAATATPLFDPAKINQHGSKKLFDEVSEATARAEAPVTAAKDPAPAPSNTVARLVDGFLTGNLLTSYQSQETAGGKQP